jgi:hypothetical protein
VSQQVTLFAQETGAQLNPKFKALAQANIGMDLGDGIRGSYGIVGIKAGKFRIKYKGAENILLNPDGTPVGYIDVVIVKANAFLNKQYFEGKYVDGANAAPVCYSLDGVQPSDASKTKQATTCALCPKNQFGSLIGENGVKQKACRDTKKLAVVPAADIRNQTMGGAMLFRVPPSSLKALGNMADQLKGRGYPYNSVVVRISFDLDASHPKPIFTAQRPLNDSETDAVLEMYESDSVMRVLADNDVVVEHGEESVGTAPVQPAGMPRKAAPQGTMPSAAETAPVPQAKPMLAGMPGDPPIAGVAPQPLIMPAVDPTPRAIRVKPDVEPVNPFAQPAAAKVSATPSNEGVVAATAAANPFSPPPGVKPSRPAEAMTIDVQATEVVEEAPSQLKDEISAIVSGLGIG